MYDNESRMNNINKEQQKKTVEELMRPTANARIEHEIKVVKESKFFLILSFVFGTIFILTLIVTMFSKGKTISFKGNEVYYENKKSNIVGAYKTAVVTDNIYTGVTVNNENDARDLIVKDSNNQKEKCTNEKVKNIESRIEKNYSITATNLCEIEYDFALEIENVIKTIYKEFPKLKGYLTNLTLVNLPQNSNYIASFSAAKLFAKSNTKNTYPNVYKMSILLNSNYFLNPVYFDYSVKDCVSYGYFPNNATKYSMVAHEFGHYISFLANLYNTKTVDKLILLTEKNYNDYFNLVEDSNNGNFSQKIINEAYDNCNKKYPNVYKTVLSFRNSISEYAVVKDKKGEYIYDETIAEAFHDYYLNGDDCKVASKEIIKVLKKYFNN